MTSPIIPVILEEYKALRSELMYFLDAREKLSQLTMTLFLGQAIIILNFLAKVSLDAVIFISCVVFPLAVCLLYWRALDYTKKVLIIALYIESSLKTQIVSALNSTGEFFMWEQFKGERAKHSGFFSKSLDYSKWWLYWFCIASSWLTGFITAHMSGNGASARYTFVFAMSFMLIIVAGFASVRISKEYNEYSGAHKKPSQETPPR